MRIDSDWPRGNERKNGNYHGYSSRPCGQFNCIADLGKSTFGSSVYQQVDRNDLFIPMELW